MKKLLIYSFLLSALVFMGACKKGNYPGGEVSPYIGLYDVRNLFKGNDLVLSREVMGGSNAITGVVVSDHTEKNLPEGLLIVQDSRRLSKLRGIAIPLGAAANDFTHGDSVVIRVEGAVLKRVDGMLQLTGITTAMIDKVATNVTIPIGMVTSDKILAAPGDYESTLLAVVKESFNPLPQPGDVLEGDKVMNDSYGELILRTSANATFAKEEAPIMAKYYGIVLNTIAADTVSPRFYLRKRTDKMVLSSVIEIPDIVITGFMSDPIGTDSTYEYIQLKATRDVNFAETPFAVVTCNNANASTPTGYPANGWATGGLRSYKINLTSGSVKKNEFFYVGCPYKRINGENSTDISTTAKWINAWNYNSNNGNSFGTKTSNLLANSGNAFGMAVFAGTTVTEASKPIDVIFISTGGSIYSAGPPAKGYRICNNDWYDVINPLSDSGQEQPFYLNGSNTKNLSYNTGNLGIFNILGGVYSTSLGRWKKARSQGSITLTINAQLSEIEAGNTTTIE
ncbi:hypothetical protein SAMN05421788_108210 [Filimonas lacunae]|uniref:DUF5689 domain-containing protein n=1 Tax=Filimonas lacunae TaxID=477680 RepID=A0A173MDK4_9BACT|nr:DUF5689 domain-containing protein [Filimonas lacunae]BAV05645.1 hypothetical protein FLA_1656 [Filimonas lacunae]SIT29073.1 hypothetical protein SAMN05421788_108210 [Filimonas lacunae]